MIRRFIGEIGTADQIDLTTRRTSTESMPVNLRLVQRLFEHAATRQLSVEWCLLLIRRLLWRISIFLARESGPLLVDAGRASFLGNANFPREQVSK